MSARLVRAGAAAALLAGVAAATGATAAAKLPACLNVTDAKGDSGANNTSGVASDASMDITNVRLALTKDAFVVTTTVDKLSDKPSYAHGEETRLYFTLGEANVRIWDQRSPTRDQENTVFIARGFQVAGTNTRQDFDVKYDEAKSTVTFTIKKSVLKSAGADVDGKTLSNIYADRRGTYVALLSTFDRASTDATWKATLCK
jgi:hypothetical protein